MRDEREERERGGLREEGEEGCGRRGRRELRSMVPREQRMGKGSSGKEYAMNQEAINSLLATYVSVGYLRSCLSSHPYCQHAPGQ
jgi:hypothetical protein